MPKAPLGTIAQSMERKAEDEEGFNDMTIPDALEAVCTDLGSIPTESLAAESDVLLRYGASLGLGLSFMRLLQGDAAAAANHPAIQRREQLPPQHDWLWAPLLQAGIVRAACTNAAAAQQDLVALCSMACDKMVKVLEGGASDQFPCLFAMTGALVAQLHQVSETPPFPILPPLPSIAEPLVCLQTFSVPSVVTRLLSILDQSLSKDADLVSLPCPSALCPCPRITLFLLPFSCCCH